MAQTYQMKHNPQGTIYSLLAVESDGRMTMTFHGTDREICHEVTENADGWLCYPGAMYPGLASGKWNKMDDGRCKMEDGRGKMEDVVETADCTDCTDNEPEVIEEATDCTNYTNNEHVTVNQPRPRRQRKPRKPRVERQPSAISHQTSAIDHQPSAISPQTSSTLKAVGMVAAATVALFVIYETGLLIPLGLIGLATGGILK
jgi:hypothetical protein